MPKESYWPNYPPIPKIREVTKVVQATLLIVKNTRTNLKMPSVNIPSTTSWKIVSIVNPAPSVLVASKQPSTSQKIRIFTKSEIAVSIAYKNMPSNNRKKRCMLQKSPHGNSTRCPNDPCSEDGVYIRKNIKNYFQRKLYRTTACTF